MTTERKWKWLSLVLLVLLILSMAMPQAFAHTTNSVQHMVAHVLEISGAIQTKTDALPADPAASSDVAAAREAVLAAVGERGFSQTFVQQGECPAVVPAPPEGMTRYATISVVTTNIDADAFVRRVRPSGEVELGYVLQTTAGHPETFVEAAPESITIEVCNTFTPGTSMIVNAHWVETEM